MILFNRFRKVLNVFSVTTYLVFASPNAFTQDSTWVWRVEGSSSFKFFGLVAYQEGRANRVWHSVENRVP